MRINYRKIIFSTFLIAGCADNNVPISSQKIIKFFDSKKYNGSHNLVIRTTSSECGEWGGHEEKMIISSDSQQIFHANYLTYSYNCDTVYNLGYDPNIKLIKDTIILLDYKKLQFIKNYVYQLIEVKISEKRLPYSCNFSIVHSDSSFVISTKVCNPASAYFEQLRSLLISR